jgi:hypothetical protein
LIVATPNNLNNGCGGTLEAAPGATSILLTNGSLEANARCTISLDLRATARGVLTSPAVTLISSQAPNATAAAIDLTVRVPAPSFTMTFAPNPSIVAAGNPANAVLTFTITNNAAIPLTGLAFNHALPQVPQGFPAAGAIGMQIPAAGGAVFTNSCGAATLVATANTTTITFAGGRVEPGETCVVAIPVQTAGNVGQNTVRQVFSYLNDPVTLASVEAANVTVGPVTWTARNN